MNPRGTFPAIPGYWADVPTAMEQEITITAATGRANSNSDVDLLIVEDRPFGPGRSRRAELTRLWMALADVPIAKDLLLYSEEEYQHWATSLNHVIAQAAREGTVVYERTAY